MNQQPVAWFRAVDNIVDNEPWGGMARPPPVELLPWLYISDEMHVRMFDPIAGTGALLENRITHVLTTNSMDQSQLESLRRKLASAGIRHCFVPGEDTDEYDMIGNHWEECHRFLKEVREQGGKVVVHCQAGINRSGLISCAAMMLMENVPVLHVVKHIKERRGVLLSNLSFRRQLCLLAAKKGLLGENMDDDASGLVMATVGEY